MKKAILAVLMVVALASSVSAISFVNYNPTYPKLKLVEKDPSTWEPVPGGASATLTGVWGRYIDIVARGLEPRTSYTLIYYGNDEFNDVWPHATCIKTKTSSSWGSIFTMAQFNYKVFLNNGVDEKLWLVLSSDVDCAEGKMVAWQPEEYLFEWNTI